MSGRTLGAAVEEAMTPTTPVIADRTGLAALVLNNQNSNALGTRRLKMMTEPGTSNRTGSYLARVSAASTLPRCPISTDPEDVFTSTSGPPPRTCPCRRCRENEAVPDKVSSVRMLPEAVRTSMSNAAVSGTRTVTSPDEAPSVQLPIGSPSAMT